ncbi:MAG: hypothetical protein WKF80_03050 [Thermomicrobiales bacterium]
MEAGEPAWWFEIAPEPTPDERDAVIAALVVLGLSPVDEPVWESPEPSRWAMAGRRAAHDGLSPATRHGLPKRL